MHTAPHRDTYIHTCIQTDDDFLSPTECADEHLPVVVVVVMVVVVLVVVVVVRLTTE